MNEKTMICIPAGRAPSWGLLDSLLQLGEEVVILRTPAQMGVADARNWLAARFLESDCEWLMWLDSDATIAPGTVGRLQSWGAFIVGALCFNRRQPVFPVAYSRQTRANGEYLPMYQEVKNFVAKHGELFTNQSVMLKCAPKDALIEVGATGCHCLMTHRKVYEALEEPYFKVRKNEPWHGEDTYFLENAKLAGYQVFVDLSVLSGHNAGPDRSVGVQDFIASAQITKYKRGENDQKKE